MDLESMRRHATPQVTDFLYTQEANGIRGGMLAYTMKTFVLSNYGDVLQSITVANECCLSMSEVAKRPSIVKLFARLSSRYDAKTTIKAVQRAMLMTPATTAQYAMSDKAVDDLVAQLGNRDDRKNAKAKRVARG